jgi:ABC-type uncharacterized transport system substrate-binding protein
VAGVLACALLLLAPAAPGESATADILVVAEPGTIHDQIIGAAETQLAARDHATRLRPILVGELESALAAGPAPALVVTLGSSAARGVPTPLPVPLLHAAIPASVFPSLQAAGEAGQHSRERSALFLDQPAARQLAAIRLALPQLQRLGVLTRSGDRASLEPLLAAAPAAGIEMAVAEVPELDLLIPRVEQLLRSADALLITPDATLYNRYTLQKVLLAAYRQRKPVIGLSAAYVDAGALLAVYADPAAIGRDLGDAIAHFLENDHLAPPSHARTFAVAVNRHVARSLGLTLPSGAELLRLLQQDESGR